MIRDHTFEGAVAGADEDLLRLSDDILFLTDGRYIYLMHNALSGEAHRYAIYLAAGSWIVVRRVLATVSR